MTDNNTTWTDIQGNKHYICKMSDSYIKNCINKIKRENWRTEYLEILESELRIRELLKRDDKVAKVLYDKR